MLGVFLLDQKVVGLVEQLIADYYATAGDIFPNAIEKREFGFGDFEKKISYRHFSFKSKGEFKKYAVDNAPAFISYSAAEYERPAARPMEAKGWLGSELIFDLDSTDLHLACQEQHGRSWVCENCLSSIKKETIRLIEDYLIPDFGFSDKEITVNFSGNRGYHVHVVNDDVLKLDAKARRQISEYITGTGIEAGRLFELRITELSNGRRISVLYGPKPTDGGWGGKVARGMIGALNTGVATLEEIGVERSLAKKLFQRRADVILGISTGNWDKVKVPKKEEFWGNVIRNMSIKQSDSIDRNVTNDPQHLIRLPDTIHGDTGLVSKKLGSYKELQSFDATKDTVAFRKGTMRIHIDKVPPFSINGESYGPYENKEVELPVYAAAYLLLKRVAALK